MSQKPRKHDLRQKRSPSAKDKNLAAGASAVAAALAQNLPRHLKSLLLAVSGGVDSMVLLHAAIELAKHRGLALYVAHVDHGLRNSSAVDAAFVCCSAKRSKTPCYLFEAKNPPRSNIESWGRAVRYGFFSAVKSAVNIEAIATAHTASDNVELFLMQLFSNKTLQSMETFEARRSVYRPLLSVTRREIEEYAKHHDVQWIEDESNKSDRYLRNRVRNRLLPQLNNIFDGDVEKTIREQIKRYTELQASARDGIFQHMSQLQTASRDSGFGSRAWMNVVREQLKDLNGHSLSLYTEELFYPQIKRRLGDQWPERLKSFILGNSPQMQLPGGTTIRRKHGGIELTQSDRPTKL